MSKGKQPIEQLRELEKYDQAKALADTMVKKCMELKVKPEDSMEVLGLAVSNILIGFAAAYGVTPQEMFKIFGDGIANAEVNKKK